MNGLYRDDAWLFRIQHKHYLPSIQNPAFMCRTKDHLIWRKLDEENHACSWILWQLPGPAADAECSVAEFKNTQPMSWHCNKTRTACHSLSQNKTWKSPEWDSTYSQHQPWCKQAPVNLHILLLKLQIFSLDPSASKPAAGFSCQLFNLHDSQ